MQCPRCGADDDRVVDSRLVREGRAVRRRRECGTCNVRFTTYETYEVRPVMVIKRDGRRVAYDRAKVVAGIAKAVEKRPVTLEDIETMIESIEQDLARRGIPEVSTDAIGTLVLEYLRDLDEVAYVRFASVYRSFQDVEEFLAVLTSLRESRTRSVPFGSASTADDISATDDITAGGPAAEPEPGREDKSPDREENGPVPPTGGTPS
jgi:transcriptional repressor NrdR